MPPTSFDAYRNWLEITVEGRAPNYYEMLGVDYEVSDVIEIAAAADRAIARIRHIRPGAHVSQWAVLLDQLRVAKKCLTDPLLRHHYDEQLQIGNAFKLTTTETFPNLKTLTPELTRHSLLDKGEPCLESWRGTSAGGAIE